MGENNARAAYVAALDVEKNRMLFIVDGDPNEETWCSPGYWDAIDPVNIETFVNGSKVTFLDSIYNTQSMSSVITKMEQYGYRCTAGTKLFEVDGYPVFVFYDNDMNQAVRMSRIFLIQYLILLLVVAVITSFFMLRRMKRTLLVPINELTEAAASYSLDRQQKVGSGLHFSKLEIRTGDEIEKLSETMKTMETDLVNYISDLARVTKEKERINTELDVAKRIQEGMIPNIYPPFPDRSEFDLYASMQPAKEVGGDFYDYFLIDEDHLVVLISDVTGKGIPAALFMMASMIMIRNVAKMNKLSPAEILTTVNEQICANNPAEMFVTVWMGILEVSTGKMTAVNAGHEYPAIRHADGSFELLKDKHGFVVGGMEGVRYKDYEIQLQPGDMIFEYSDGVTDAATSENELFGTDRMVEALNSKKSATPAETIQGMKDAIKDYVGDVDQFDDITMLCLQYYGKQGAEV